ncbi:MAG: hypothetical protein ACO1OB_03335 [Archangium sp.]
MRRLLVPMVALISGVVAGVAGEAMIRPGEVFSALVLSPALLAPFWPVWLLLGWRWMKAPHWLVAGALSFWSAFAGTQLMDFFDMAMSA